jgi:hypothetical protein
MAFVLKQYIHPPIMPVSKIIRFLFFYGIIFLMSKPGFTQSISGVWRGKISKEQGGLNKMYQLEVKLVRNGDSLTGTSYYYSGKDNYARFQIKGYINPYDGTIFWWDERALNDERSNQHKNALITVPMQFETDFNCPGEGIMKLDGEAEKNNTADSKKVPVHLNKVDEPLFPDEWDYVLENFSRGANDPAIIDSIEHVYTVKHSVPEKSTESRTITPKKTTESAPVPSISVRTGPSVPKTVPAMTVEEMFVSRKKILVTEIPVTGDTVELRFYDHAEIDGDSISLFLNNQLLQKNILLKASPYVVRLPVASLQENNELIMVAENLGSIPPNTSLMIAYINDIRYEARLESTENSSAMIRFYKPSQAAKTPSPNNP